MPEHEVVPKKLCAHRSWFERLSQMISTKVLLADAGQSPFGAR